MPDWERRYQDCEHIQEPSSLITKICGSLKPGSALDLACGTGRHAVWLAERGWQVTAVDYSRTAIDIMQRRSSAAGIRINAVVADLERHEFLIEPEAFDLIIVCNYLQRDLFSKIHAGARIGGVVVAVIAMVDDDPEVKPMNPAYLVRSGELKSEFTGWDFLHYFEGKRTAGRRAMAELAARRIQEMM
jgi:tellurite methyltransferase